MTRRRAARLRAMLCRLSDSMICERKSRTKTTLQLLAHMMRFEATDPRDLAFSVVGLVTDELLDALQVDYRTSVRDIYMNTIRSILQNSRPADGLHFLGYGAASDTDGGDVLRWTPDWRRPATVSPLPVKLVPARPLLPENSGETSAAYSAGIPETGTVVTGSDDACVPRIENEALGVYGFDVDAVEDTFALLSPSILSRGRDLGAMPAHVAGDGFWSAYLRTVAADVVIFVRNDVLPNDKIFVFLDDHVLYVLRPRDDGSYRFVGGTLQSWLDGR